MYNIDPINGDIIINGFQNGIGSSPHMGLTDLRNIDIITIPGEAPVGFSTASQIPVVTAVPITSYSNSTIFFSALPAALPVGTAIYFTSVGSLSGVTTATPYWVSASSTTSATLSSTYNSATAVSISGTPSGAAFSTYLVGTTPGGQFGGTGPTYFAFDGQYYWMLDACGQVWTNATPMNLGVWSFTGNKVPITNYYTGGGVFSTAGNGLVFYESTDGHGYLFVFHGSSIDYTAVTTPSQSANISWIYQYDPGTPASPGGYNPTPTKKLNTSIAYTGSHMAISATDNAIYYCDGNTIGSIVPTNTGTYNPASAATFTWNGGGNIVSGRYALQLPANDIANCLAELGINLLVGAQLNRIYPWNRTAASFSYPIFLAESNLVKMVTVNTNTYIFCGNRGRIYITNGTNAQLAYKVPDHLSGTVEPYFFWGGVTFNRNELYFGVYATKNDGNPLTTGNNAYGGVWAVNFDTGALRLINQLSYGTYAGYASAMIAEVQSVANLFTTPPGSGLYIGWANATPGSSPVLYGIDATTTSPYTGGQAYIISDMIPVGTAIEPQTPAQFEYRLANPLLAGESVQLSVATNATLTTASFTNLGTTNGTTATALVADIFPSTIQNTQWILVKATLTSSTSNATPSYNRLTEMRVKGLTIRP